MSRYIDADALFMDVIHRYDYCDDFIEMIEAMPTADVRENVHGEWIPCGGSFRCSECASMPEFKDIRRLHFCPNCGAEIRSTSTVSDTKGGWDGEYYLEDC